jgi:hypothetical protein
MASEFAFDPRLDFNTVMANWVTFCEGRLFQIQKAIEAAQGGEAYGQAELERIKTGKVVALEAEESKWAVRLGGAEEGFFVADPSDIAYMTRNQDFVALASRYGKIAYRDEIDRCASGENSEATAYTPKIV